MIISIDFDGTCVEHAFPDIGELKPYCIETLKGLLDQEHYLILNTCREDEGFKINKQYLTSAVKFMQKHGITFCGINETPREIDFRKGPAFRRKVYANMYIDDRNFGGFPGWEIIAEHFNIKL